jgi:hypothetical protein
VPGSRYHSNFVSGSTRIASLVVCVLFLVSIGTVGAKEPNVAGLIVDYGDGRMSYAVVPFDEENISGVDLLEMSGLDLVTIGFGGLGDAVCQIDDTGCPVDDCRKRLCQTSDPESPYWQFSKLADDEWLFVATGASGAKVQDGDVYAWSWIGTTPDLPTMSIDELAERAGGHPGQGDDVRAHLRTDGAPAGDDESGASYLAIAGIGGVVIVAGALVFRARAARHRPEVIDGER